MALNVRGWMSRDPLSVGVDDSALEAFDRMVERGIRHLPVVGEDRRLVGIVSIDDLRAAFPVHVDLKQALGPKVRQQLLDVGVADAMTWAPVTVHPEASLEEAARSIAQGRIGCLPVVEEGGRLVGILTEIDLIRALLALLRGEEAPSREPAERDELVAGLRAERLRLLRQIEDWQEAERSLSADIREEPRDSADRAIDERDVSRLAPLADRASRRLGAIEAALERAEEGRLDLCERCGGRIPPTRLRAIPEATLCVRCARLDEAGGAGMLPPR